MNIYHNYSANLGTKYNLHITEKKTKQKTQTSLLFRTVYDNTKGNALLILLDYTLNKYKQISYDLTPVTKEKKQHHNIS